MQCINSDKLTDTEDTGSCTEEIPETSECSEIETDSLTNMSTSGRI